MNTGIYTTLFANNISRSRKVKDGVWRGRCPVCGDSEKDKRRTRFYLLATRQPPWTYCHNCGYSKSAKQFFKTHFPAQWRSAINDIAWLFGDNEPQQPEPAPDPEDSDWAKEAATFLSTQCLPLTSKQTTLQKVAIKYCQARRIPDTFIKTFFVCVKGTYALRLIIPFYNDQEEVYYLQARALKKDMEPKYLTRDFEESPNLVIYRWHQADPDELVIITEGLIDCMYVKNGMSLCGAAAGPKTRRIVREKFSNVIYVFDNDETGMQATKQFLEAGERCFIWPDKYSSVKDIGEVMQKELTSDPTSVIIEDSYRGPSGLVRMVR